MILMVFRPKIVYSAIKQWSFTIAHMYTHDVMSRPLIHQSQHEQTYFKIGLL